MQIVFLINLALDLTINGEAEKEGILLARGGRGVNLILIEDIRKGADGLGGGAHLLLYRILEVARKLLDFLDLLLQIASQTSEGEDNVLFNLLGLVRFLNGGFIVRAKELQGVFNTGRLEKAIWSGHIVDSIAKLG